MRRVKKNKKTSFGLSVRQISDVHHLATRQATHILAPARNKRDKLLQLRRKIFKNVYDNNNINFCYFD